MALELVRILGKVFTGSVAIPNVSRRVEKPTEITFTQDLSSAPLSFTTSIGTDFILNYIGFVLRDTATNLVSSSLQTLIYSKDAVAGANFDMEFLKRKQLFDHFFFVPVEQISFKTGNEIKIDLTNIGTPSITVRGIVSIIGV